MLVECHVTAHMSPGSSVRNFVSVGRTVPVTASGAHERGRYRRFAHNQVLGKEGLLHIIFLVVASQRCSLHPILSFGFKRGQSHSSPVFQKSREDDVPRLMKRAKMSYVSHNSTTSAIHTSQEQSKDGSTPGTRRTGVGPPDKLSERGRGASKSFEAGMIAVCLELQRGTASSD